MSASDAAGLTALIRHADGGDAVLIDEMLAALAAETAAPGMKSSRAADLCAAMSAMPPQIFALVAEVPSGPAGLCLWLPYYSTWRGGLGVYVQDLYIVPEARGLGLGRRLLAAARASCPQACFIRLAVASGNAAGLQFYERLGFSRMEGETVLDLSGDGFRLLAACEEEATGR